MNFSRFLIYFMFRQMILHYITHASNVFLYYVILLKRPVKTGIEVKVLRRSRVYSTQTSMNM